MCDKENEGTKGHYNQEYQECNVKSCSIPLFDRRMGDAKGINEDCGEVTQNKHQGFLVSITIVRELDSCVQIEPLSARHRLNDLVGRNDRVSKE